MGLFEQFKAAGLLVIPEKQGIPLKGVEWSKYSLETVPEFEDKATGYGLVCGKVSDVIGVDIDTDDEDVIRRVEAFSGVSLVKKRGSKGFTAFFKYNGEKSQVWKKDGKVIIELLSDGRKTTIPPSKYKKEAFAYTYITENTLFDKEVLQSLPNNFTACLDMLYPKPLKEYRDFSHVVHEDIDLSQAQEMLSFISPDLSYLEWVEIGMSLKSEFGDAAFQLWDSWSSKGVEYKSSGMWSKWRSFDNGAVTIRTLIWHAKQGGWIKSYKIEKEEVEVDLSYHHSIYDTIPNGLVKDIYEWILATSIMPQPPLALAASICAVGTIKGQKFATETDLRSNILAFGLAPSGSGKDHARKCINKIFAQSNCDILLSGQPASHVGLVNCLYRDGGVKLILIDEIGRLLQSLTSKNAMPHQRDIMTEIMMLFSSASSKYRGREYADSDNKNPPKTIEQPCLSVYGTTVAENLYDALTSRDAIDGFLSRWLVFETTEIPDDKEFVSPMGKVPEIILEEIRKIRNTFSEEIFSPTVIKFTPEAREYNKQLRAKYKEKIRQSVSKRDNLDSIYARVVEHINKLALVVVGDKIDLKGLQWAESVVGYSTTKMVSLAAEHISESEFDASVKKVYAVISEMGSITRWELCRKCRKFKSKELDEAIDMLAQRRKISVKVEGEGVKKSITYIASV